MRICIACIGKLKEPYFREAASEYKKRLGRYAQIEFMELSDEKAPEGLSLAEKDAVLAKEGARLLKGIGEKEQVVALCIEGARYTSMAFATALKDWFVQGGSSVTFVIGGSLGLSPDVMKRANDMVSFSDMTFPHQLARIMLLEQLYRAFKINGNEPYHK